MDINLSKLLSVSLQASMAADIIHVVDLWVWTLIASADARGSLSLILLTVTGTFSLSYLLNLCQLNVKTPCFPLTLWPVDLQRNLEVSHCTFELV